MSKYYKVTPVADSVPYDKDKDPNCDLESETVQDAIDELCTRATDGDNAGNHMIIVTCDDGSCVVEASELIDHNFCFMNKPQDC